ncbi:MAG: response regulator [Anaerolineae bacterium]|nr:response regulator [Anaerolineae bacterium]
MGVDAERYERTLSALQRTAGLALVLLWLVLVRHNTDWLLFALSVGLTSLLGASLALSSRLARLSGLLLLAVPTAAAVWGALGGQPSWSFLLVLPVVAAGLLYGPWAAPASAIVLLPLLLAVPPLAQAAVPLVVCLLAVAGVTYAGVGEYVGLLRLHWERSRLAHDLVAQARERQGELNQAVKALDLAYRLLEESHYQTAVARREAEEWRDLKTRFATNLSHELRTPLNVILGFAQLIYRNPQLYGFDGWPEALMRDLVQVQRNAAYLSDLVNDIVDMARVDALAMPIRREQVNPVSLISEVLDTLSSVAQQKGILLRQDLAQPLPDLNVDPVRVRQVLFNLITNAIRFTDAGSVTVSAVVEGNEVVISVADTGRGIAPDQLEGIFDEFLQVGRPKEGEDPGKGLGLAIARRFVHLHGGRMWVRSEEGKGSTFYFALPLMDKTTARSVVRSSGALPRPSSRPRVLVVDDDGVAAAYLERQLGGYEFVRVDSCNEAARQVVDVRPIAAIVNVAPDSIDPLPAETALAGVPLIHCVLPSIRWLSGHDRFDGMLGKPVSAESLLEVLDRFLERDRPASVLVADDDRSFVQLVTRTLQASGRPGIEVVPAYSGADALRRARRQRPDLVLMDLVMPELNGFEALERLRQDADLRHVPVVAVTAASPGEDDLAARGTTFSLRTRRPNGQRLVLQLIAGVLENARGELPSDTDAVLQRSLPEIPAS